MHNSLPSLHKVEDPMSFCLPGDGNGMDFREGPPLCHFTLEKILLPP